MTLIMRLSATRQTTAWQTIRKIISEQRRTGRSQDYGLAAGKSEAGLGSGTWAGTIPCSWASCSNPKLFGFVPPESSPRVRGKFSLVPGYCRSSPKLALDAA